ncbi:hypothetical protein BgiBS90_026422, partial [Biomphalaria glabrata]
QPNGDTRFVGTRSADTTLLTLHKCPIDNASHRPVTALTDSSRSRALQLRTAGLHPAPGSTTTAHQQVWVLKL